MAEHGIRPARAPHVGPDPHRSRTFLAVLRPAVTIRDRDAALLHSGSLAIPAVFRYASLSRPLDRFLAHRFRPWAPFADVLTAGRDTKRSAALPACPGFTPRFARFLAFLLARYGDCTAFCLNNLRLREPPARMGPAHHPISAYPRVPPPPLRPWLIIGSAGSSGTQQSRPVTTLPCSRAALVRRSPPSKSVRLRHVTLSALQDQPDPTRFPKQGRANHSQSGAYGRSRPCPRTSMPPPGRARQLQERGSQTRLRVRRERPGDSE